ncbi:DUF2974 domain-containing protein [Ruminiclostridium herbifermentans]|uniref:DUF2974 domain-containing protein n=1 Tax=Ruminiclostridium herbifermentans TaxID=2488810 RepID=A0A4U7JGU5_9FIRM|nr:Mbeg1-like protein [Ruminiclostridium herbifermentans]QNU67815.1 DUF2974 domain-containing protein [Ruminiclostridium herbifermentans]
MSNIDDNTLSQANEAALLNVLMYLDIEDVKVEDGWTLNRIISKLSSIYDSPDGYNKYLDYHEKGSEADYADRQRQYQILANACKSNEHFANLIIDNQSSLMTNPSYQVGGLEACTFNDTSGNVFVVYRGTGAGEWIDNGKGLSGLGVETPQQIEAREYFERIVEANGYDDNNANIIISGHSKGGNKAQYVTITSQYNYLINNCFNFDGQGFSPEAIAEFISRYGKEAYLQAVNKMFGFYAENDYVNPLGIPVIPEENRTYFESQIVDGIMDSIKEGIVTGIIAGFADGIEGIKKGILNGFKDGFIHGLSDKAKHHYADAYLDIDGSFSNITEQGELSKYIQTVSANIMSLPPALRSRVTAAMMGICQNLLGGGVPVNGDSVSLVDYLVGIPVAVNVLLGSLFETIIKNAASFLITNLKEVVGAVLEVLGGLVNSIVDGIKQIGSELLDYAKELGAVLSRFASEIKKAWDNVTSFIGGLANDIVDGIVSIGETVVDAVIDVGEAVVDTAVSAGTAIVDGINDLKEKATNAISSFFTGVKVGVKNIIYGIGNVASDTWNNVKQTTEKIINSAKEQIGIQYEAFKEGANYLVSYVKGTINNLGEKCTSAFKSFKQSIITGVIKGCITGKLVIDLVRLAHLREKTRNLNSYFEESVTQIIREAEKVTCDVGRSYSESYVQQQLSRVNSICIQIEKSNKRIYDALQRKDNGLRYALDQYSQKEALLCQQVNYY